MRSHPIQFKTGREMRVDTIIHSSADLYPETILAETGCLRQDVRASKDSVQPRFPFASAPGNFRTAAITDVFYVLVLIYRPGECGIDAALDAEPLVGEIGYGGIGPDTRFVIQGRAKSYQGNA